MKKVRLVLRRARLLLPAVAFMGISGCKSGTEKAVLGFVGEGSCPTRNAVLDAKEDEVLVGQAPSCPQKHAFIDQDTCKKLTGDGPCVAHGRAAKAGPDEVDYCLTKSADAFKLDAGCTAAAALVRQYFAADGCDERAKLLFAPDENKEQLALLKGRQKSCKADIKSLDLAACAGTLHAKEGRCVAKTTLGDGKVAEVCVRRDNDKLSVDLRCTEMLDGADGRRVVVKVVKNYNKDFSEKDYVSVELAISESTEPQNAWLRKEDKREGIVKLRSADEPTKVVVLANNLKDKHWVVRDVVGAGGWQLAATPPPKCREGMSLVPGAALVMGVNDYAARATDFAEVAAFCMDTTEVTTAAYATCVKSGKCTAVKATSRFCNAGFAERGNHPINCVDWKQATAYCEAQGQRLPTEEEWEYAAFGTDGRMYPWGDAEPAGQLCWNRNGKGMRNSTCAVASFPAGNSPFGLSDMSGNVWEWTSSAYNEGEGRGIRGGCWALDDPRSFLSIIRVRVSPSDRSAGTGFRCAGSFFP